MIQEIEENELKILPTVVVIAIFIFSLVSLVAVNASEINAENIVNLVNKERSAYGLSALKVNQELENAAVEKSKDMLFRNYFDHYAFGQTPWMFIIRAGYNYSIAGENLAKGFSTSEGVVNAWMNSASHRENILNPQYQEIGVGVVKGSFSEGGELVDTTMTTELLAKPKSGLATFLERIANSIFSIF